MGQTDIPAAGRTRRKPAASHAPLGCVACAVRRPGWFCALGASILAELELAAGNLILPAQSELFVQGEQARCLFLICSGYLKLTAGRANDRRMIVRVAGPGSMLGLYAALAHGIYEVSAETLTAVELRPVERAPFLALLGKYKEAEQRAMQCLCQEYRFALQDACRIALAETVAGRLGRLLLELGHQIGEARGQAGLCFPLLLTHEELASMASTTRETVTRTLGQFRREGWISIEDSLVTLREPARLESLA